MLDVDGGEVTKCLQSQFVIVTFMYIFPNLQRLDGCVCVNPGRLTKKTSGGTFIKIIIKDQCQTKEDFSSDIGVKIVHI